MFSKAYHLKWGRHSYMNSLSNECKAILNKTHNCIWSIKERVFGSLLQVIGGKRQSLYLATTPTRAAWQNCYLSLDQVSYFGERWGRRRCCRPRGGQKVLESSLDPHRWVLLPSFSPWLGKDSSPPHWDSAARSACFYLIQKSQSPIFHVKVVSITLNHSKGNGNPIGYE